MSCIDSRWFLYESVHEIENRCMDVFGCSFFETAYRCRLFLRSKGYSDVLTVRICDGAYLPMPRVVYREWRRLNREFAALDAGSDL